MKNLVVFRHGEDIWDELTTEGRETVEAVAESLKKILVASSTVIVSSPLERAVQTAEIISKILGKPFGIHPALDHEAQVVPDSRDELGEFPETL